VGLEGSIAAVPEKTAAPPTWPPPRPDGVSPRSGWVTAVTGRQITIALAPADALTSERPAPFAPGVERALVRWPQSPPRRLRLWRWPARLSTIQVGQLDPIAAGRWYLRPDRTHVDSGRTWASSFRPCGDGAAGTSRARSSGAPPGRRLHKIAVPCEAQGNQTSTFFRLPKSWPRGFMVGVDVGDPLPYHRQRFKNDASDSSASTTI
jgi:hypothetical protein